VQLRRRALAQRLAQHLQQSGAAVLSGGRRLPAAGAICMASIIV
jgi:hypothetical protein